MAPAGRVFRSQPADFNFVGMAFSQLSRIALSCRTPRRLCWLPLRWRIDFFHVPALGDRVIP
jgi:hypothetical protein